MINENGAIKNGTGAEGAGCFECVIEESYIKT